MGVREPSIRCHERNLFKQRFGWHPEPYHVFHGKTVNAKHHNKRAIEQPISEGNISMMNLLNEKLFDKIAESAEARFWKGFVTLRSASVCVLTVFITIQIIKLIIDTIMHEYVLHSIYWCSIHLVAVIYSLTFSTFSSISANQLRQGKKEQQLETFPTTEILDLNPLSSRS